MAILDTNYQLNLFHFWRIKDKAKEPKAPKAVNFLSLSAKNAATDITAEAAIDNPIFLGKEF